MEWQAQGIILSVRSHGENSAIAEILTAEHGRHAGLVRGATSKRMRGILQPGNLVDAHWRARLAEHLGMFSIEAVQARAVPLFDDALALAGLNAACALAVMALPEREAHPQMYNAFDVLTGAMDNNDLWPALYVRWEAGILQALGYGLALERCVASGAVDNLTHVSPRSGAAVSADAAAPYLDQLMPLPGFLRDSSCPLEAGDIANGLALTGFFLERRVLWPINKTLPEARARLLERLSTAGRL